MFVARFEGMTPEESRPPIDSLERRMTRLAVSHRVRWTPGRLVIRDNRSTLHPPCDDFTGHPRFTIRCAAPEPGTP